MLGNLILSGVTLGLPAPAGRTAGTLSGGIPLATGTTSTLRSGILAGDPAILPHATGDALNFHFKFHRSYESEAEVALAFQYGSTLAGWTGVAIGATSGTSGPGIVVTEDSPSSTVDTVRGRFPRALPSEAGCSAGSMR